MPQLEEKISIGLYLPKQIVDQLDQKRGRFSRSAYVATILERLLKGRTPRIA
jgi:metal-responsive CopG/Arc/MetJ family transcriptional regulator